MHPPTPKQIMCSESKQSHFGQPCVNDSWGMALPQSLCVCVWRLKAPGRPSASPPGSQTGFGASHSLGQSNDADVAPVTSWFLGKLPLDRFRVAMPLLHTPSPASSPACQNLLHRGSKVGVYHASWPEGRRERQGSDVPDGTGESSRCV